MVPHLESPGLNALHRPPLCPCPTRLNCCPRPRRRHWHRGGQPRRRCRLYWQGRPLAPARGGNDIRDLERLIAHAHRFHSRCSSRSTPSCATTSWKARARWPGRCTNAGADALIIQDMGLLELDLPIPIQLHASTQTDIRTPERRFPAGLRPEPDRAGARADLRRSPPCTRQDPQRCAIEFSSTGAVRGLQRPVLHQPRQNRPQCQPGRLQPDLAACPTRSPTAGPHRCARQACALDEGQQPERQPARLIDAGVRSFKIEGRYKDMGYVKNITAHYRACSTKSRRARGRGDPRASSGRTTVHLHARPAAELQPRVHRLLRQRPPGDIGAFDTPKNPGQAIGWVTNRCPTSSSRSERPGHRAAQRRRPVLLHDLQKELVAQINRAEPVHRRKASAGACSWDPMEGFRTCAKAPRSTATATWTGTHAGEEVQRPAHRPVGAVARNWTASPSR